MVIEALGNGRAQELQEMDFDPIPQKGDLLTIALGSVTAKFEVEAIIHKVKLGKKNQIVLRVRNVGGPTTGGQQQPSGMPPQRQLPAQQQTQRPMLPAGPPGPLETPQDLKFDLDPDDYYNS
jgi:hypothetical protein